MKPHKHVGVMLAMALVLIGCAPYKAAKGPIEVGYVLLDDYASAQKTAISIIQDPLVPENVKDAIRKADYAANPLGHPELSPLHIFRDKLKDYVLLKAELDALQSAGRDPGQERIDKTKLALEEAQRAFDSVKPLVLSLINLADK